MEPTLTAIELTGTVDERHELRLDDILPIQGPQRVRVIVLYSSGDEWDEGEWLHTAGLSPAFDFLQDPEEDICTLADGKPVHDEA